MEHTARHYRLGHQVHDFPIELALIRYVKSIEESSSSRREERPGSSSQGDRTLPPSTSREKRRPSPRTGPLYPQALASGPSYQQPPASTDSASNAPPPAQQRTMVMPDRMRWVYLDPQGQVQGPWSGLEMHDWYKASFFTADLSVKKLEDDEFEPLAQLIRRIGNSREPFLVPQIGIPHGPPTTQAGSPFASAIATSGSGLSQPGVVQPPFAGAFPSFGTTLTAEQQNNLERRKQEEQYLMARQREFLDQQLVNMKMRMQGGIPGALHHRSSAHSLQSQPSFGKSPGSNLQPEYI
jgi:PERQ amino acid-rich with GYF domain-containing protein